MKNSGTLSESACLPTFSSISPSVEAPSVTTTTAASDEPRKSLSTCLMAVPTCVVSCDGSAFISRILSPTFSISSTDVAVSSRCAREAKR